MISLHMVALSLKFPSLGPCLFKLPCLPPWSGHCWGSASWCSWGGGSLPPPACAAKEAVSPLHLFALCSTRDEDTASGLLYLAGHGIQIATVSRKNSGLVSLGARVFCDMEWSQNTSWANALSWFLCGRWTFIFWTGLNSILSLPNFFEPCWIYSVQKKTFWAVQQCIRWSFFLPALPASPRHAILLLWRHPLLLLSREPSVGNTECCPP